MANNYATLSELFVDVANAIRHKNGSTQAIIANNFPTEISNLRTGDFNYYNNNITAIADYEFYNCTDINNVSCINLTSIGKNAFEGCSKLKTIILWNNIEVIGENAFKGCFNTTIYCRAESKPDGWHENWNPDNCEVVWGYAPQESWNVSDNTEEIVTASLYNDVTNEGMYQLVVSGNGNMSTSSTSMPWKDYLNEINSIIISDGVTSISADAFYGCSNLTSVTIPDSVTSIGGNAFRGCNSLPSVTLPDSITSVGNKAFYDCASLKKVNITSLEAWCNIDFLDSSSTPFDLYNLYLNNQLITDLVIPDTITELKNMVFSSCVSFTSAIIPNSVTTIGRCAFYDCPNLTSISIPDSVTDIKYLALGKTAITSLTIPNSVLNIEDFIVNSCASLVSAIIPDSINKIPLATFAACSSLTSVTIPGSITIIEG